MAEATDPALGLRQFGDGHELGLRYGFDDQLGHPVAPVHLVGRLRVGVDEQDPQLVPVASVDQAGGIQDSNTMAHCQTAPGLHKAGVTGRDGDCDPRRDESAPATGGDGDIVARTQVGSGIAGPGITRQLQVSVEPADLYPDHAVAVHGLNASERTPGSQRRRRALQ